MRRGGAAVSRGGKSVDVACEGLKGGSIAAAHASEGAAQASERVPAAPITARAAEAVAGAGAWMAAIFAGAAGVMALACAMAGAAHARDLGLTGGLYGATLGAGGACGAEPAAFGANPAAFDPGEGVGLSFHRPFGLEDVATAEASGYFGGGRFGGSAAWRETSVDGLFREDTWEYRQSYRLITGRFGPLDFGGAWSYGSQAFPGQRNTVFTQGYGILWQALPRLKAGAFAAGLPFDPDRDLSNEAVFQWGFEASSRAAAPVESQAAGGPPAQILRLDFRKTGATPWRGLLALSLSPHRSLQFTVGLSTDPFQASLGVKLRWAGLFATQAWRYHRYLGGTFLTGAGFSRSRRGVPPA
jgi:hypothetical protein